MGWGDSSPSLFDRRVAAGGVFLSRAAGAAEFGGFAVRREKEVAVFSARRDGCVRAVCVFLFLFLFFFSVLFSVQPTRWFDFSGRAVRSVPLAPLRSRVRSWGWFASLRAERVLGCRAAGGGGAETGVTRCWGQTEERSVQNYGEGIFRGRLVCLSKTKSEGKKK